MPLCMHPGKRAVQCLCIDFAQRLGGREQSGWCLFHCTYVGTPCSESCSGLFYTIFCVDTHVYRFDSKHYDFIFKIKIMGKLT